MDTRTIFFIGKPGCGKGTQAKLLSELTGWSTYSSGDLFRAIAKEDSPVGHKVKEENDAGLLQPHWFAMYLFLKTLFSIPGETSVIFDGFCRKVPEAELVIDSLRWLNRSFTVLNVQISDDTVLRRLALRKGVEGRADDSVVDERLKEYHTYTEPALKVFRTAGVLVDVDGEPTPEDIAVAVRTVLNIK